MIYLAIYGLLHSGQNPRAMGVERRQCVPYNDTRLRTRLHLGLRQRASDGRRLGARIFIITRADISRYAVSVINSR